ncbi:MAG: hypothetical protein LBW85_12025 [Deltaproteobacteria bacterium]|jgi:hypothetical protein|nr:hypothetical protein [Deltaproteobacteria bacterium]
MDMRATVDRILGYVEDYAALTENLSQGYFRHFMEGTLDQLAAELAGVNAAAADTLEILRPLVDTMDGGSLTRLAEARLRTEAGSVFGLCAAGRFGKAAGAAARLAESIHPEAKTPFTVQVACCLVLFASLQGDREAAERHFAAMPGDALPWELLESRAMAAFNILTLSLREGLAEESLPYYCLIAELADALRATLVRESGLEGLPEPEPQPMAPMTAYVSYFGQDFPFGLVRRTPPPLPEAPERQRLLKCLDRLVKMRFNAVLTMGAHLIPLGKGLVVRELYEGLSDFSSTGSDYVRLAALGRDLALVCCQSEEHLGDGPFYLEAVERSGPSEEFCACAAQLVTALAERRRLPEAKGLFARMTGRLGRQEQEDWIAQAATALVTGCLLRGRSVKALYEMEAVYETLLALGDSPAVRQCRLFAETNMLPFCLMLKDSARISSVYGRIAANPDRSQTALEMKLLASTNLVSYYAAGGMLEEARSHFILIDTDMHREPPFLLNWARAAVALCAGIYKSGGAAEAWSLAGEIGRYRQDPEVAECMGPLDQIMGGSIPN